MPKPTRPAEESQPQRTAHASTTQDADLTDHSRTCLHCAARLRRRCPFATCSIMVAPSYPIFGGARGAPLPSTASRNAALTRHPSAKELASFGLRLHHSHCHQSDTWPYGRGRLWAKLEFTDATCISHSLAFEIMSRSTVARVIAHDEKGRSKTINDIVVVR